MGTGKKSLGDRMKGYEDVNRTYLTRRTPVIVRVDGAHFHTYTAKAQRPFDPSIQNAIMNAARETARSIQGFRIGYAQSDEASFLLVDYESLDTCAWFDGNLQKVVSTTAATMTYWFNWYIERMEPVYQGRRYDRKNDPAPATFDARAFNIPREDVANYFLWRYRDWVRNSLQMYAGAFFSHKQLHGKNGPAKHEMLHGIGKNWATDLDEPTRNGTWLVYEPASDEPGSRSGIVLRHDKFEDIKKTIESAVYPAFRLGVRSENVVFDKLFELYKKGALPIEAVCHIFNFSEEDIHKTLRSENVFPRINMDKIVTELVARYFRKDDQTEEELATSETTDE